MRSISRQTAVSSVCMTERQQEIEQAMLLPTEPLNSLTHSLPLSLSLSLSPPHVAVRAACCVARDGQRQDGYDNYGLEQSRVKNGALRSSSATSLNDIISHERVFALRNRVFCLIAPNGWAIASQHFEGPYRLLFPSVAGTFLRYVGKKSPTHATQKRRIQVHQIITSYSLGF